MIAKTLRRLTVGSVLVAGIAATSSSLYAQNAEMTDGESVSSSSGLVQPKTSLRITLSGELKSSVVVRNEELFDAAIGASGATPTSLAPTTGTGSGGDVFFDPMITLNMDIQLSEKASAFIQLETQFNEIYNTPGRAGGAVGADRDLEIEQAYVTLEELFFENLDVQIGIQDFRKDYTGNGNPILVDVHHSESPFGNPTFNETTANSDFGAPQSAGSGAVGLIEAAGALGRFDLGDGANLDLFYFTIGETFRSNSDDTLWGASLEKSYMNDSKVETARAGFTVMGLQNDGSSILYTIGGGGFVNVADETIKLYGEAYVQGGQYGRTAGDDIDQEDAFAIYGGLRWALPGFEEQNGFFDISYWEISGDDEGDDFRNENFVSLENNNDTIVMEDGYYGLDVDTNYRAVKLKAGFDPTAKTSIQALWAWFGLQDNNGAVDQRGSKTDRLGQEVDLSFDYRPTDNVVLGIRSGWLFGARALGATSTVNITVVDASIEF